MVGADMQACTRLRSAASVILALGVLLAGAHPAPAVPPEIAALKRTVCFLDLMAKMNYKETNPRDTAVWGVTTLRRGEERLATFSVYDDGLDDIPDDMGAGVVLDAFARSCRDLESGVATGARRKAALRDSSEVVVRLPWRDVRFLVATHEVAMTGPAAGSAAEILCRTFFTVMDGQFVRARYTHRADETSDAEARRALDDFACAIAVSYLDASWKSEEDFRRAEPQVRIVARWLFDDPRHPPDELVKKATWYVRMWILRAPYVKVPVDAGEQVFAPVYEDCECKDFVDTAYLVGCALHLMDSPTSDRAATRLAGVEFVLDAHAKLVAAGGQRTDCAGLLPLVIAHEAGALATMLGE